MDNLPEELLDHIISAVVRPLPSRHGGEYDDLLNLSLVSHKFHRLTDPYLYHSVILSEDNNEQFLRTTEAHARLSLYARELLLVNFQDIARQVQCLATRLPYMYKLDLDLKFDSGRCFESRRLADILPILQLPSITALRLSSVVCEELSEPRSVNWAITNTSIATLEMSIKYFSHNANYAGEDISRFASIFEGLRSLSVHGEYEFDEYNQRIPRCLDRFAFRRLVYAFKHAFETSLRTFSFKYNAIVRPYGHERETDFGDPFDARGILQQSHLEYLQIDTASLHRPWRTEGLRSLDLCPTCLPSSLRTLYLRHVTGPSEMNSELRKWIINPDEQQCLSKLFDLGACSARFPHLKKMTLVIFIELSSADTALKMINAQARKVKVDLDLMVLGLGYDVSYIHAEAWPEYDTILLQPRASHCLVQQPLSVRHGDRSTLHCK